MMPEAKEILPLAFCIWLVVLNVLLERLNASSVDRKDKPFF